MSLSASLRRFIQRKKESKSRIARESRITYKTLSDFLDGNADIRLQTLDRLAEYLGLELARQRGNSDLAGDSVSKQLQAELSECGSSHYQISKESGVDRTSIRLFLRGERNIELKTADRLARYLGLRLRKAKSKKETR